MADLASLECVPCRGGVPPLKGEEIKKFSEQLQGWEVVEEHHLRKLYEFKDFREALDFVNRGRDVDLQFDGAAFVGSLRTLAAKLGAFVKDALADRFRQIVEFDAPA